MTFSIAARDEETGQLGVASASHAYGVGIADHARPGCGAVATQAFVEVSYGPRGLDLLGMGIAPQEALAALLSADPDREIRQVAFVGASGEIAHHTGARCVPSRGAVVAGTSIAIGNMLDNDRVLHAVSDAFNEGEGDLADRLVAGLEAGEKAAATSAAGCRRPCGSCPRSPPPACGRATCAWTTAPIRWPRSPRTCG